MVGKSVVTTHLSLVDCFGAQLPIHLLVWACITREHTILFLYPGGFEADCSI